MNTAGAIAVLLGALVVAGVIIAYPRLRAGFRRPATLTANERERVFALLPWAGLLDARQRERLAAATAQMRSEVRFVGCNGLAVTGDMQLAIAGQAALLCLGTHGGVFELPREVLLYPDAFYIPRDLPDEQGLVDDRPMLASGEAWDAGRIVLSWADIAEALGGAAHNVVVHEFAHLLDFAAPWQHGAPPQVDADDWERAFAAAFEQLRIDGSSILDSYGTQNRAEFFAVAVEAFFQRGAGLASAHPRIYRLLADYFEIDTAAATPAFTPVTPR